MNANNCEHKSSTVLWNNETHQLLACDWGCNGMLWSRHGKHLVRVATIPDSEERGYDVLMDAFELIAEESHEL